MATGGKVTVLSNTTIRCTNDGFLWCTMPVQDFLLPEAGSVVLQLDGNDLTVNGTRSTTARVTWPARIGRSPTSTFTSSGTNESPPVGVGAKNGQRTLAFRDDSPPLEGIWGPFFSASFTIIAVVRTLEPVTINVSVLSQITPRSFVLALPFGDTTSVFPALGNRTWSQAFIHEWHVITFQNKSSTGQCLLYVDNELVSTTAASTSPITDIATTLFVGGGSPLEIAEIVVWDTETVPVAEVVPLFIQKWNTAINYPPTVPDTGSVNIPSPLPNALWLDASDRSTLETATGHTADHRINTSITTWGDRNGGGRHVSLGPTPGRWDFSPVTRQNGRPMLRLPAGCQGSIPASVTAGLGALVPFTLVVVFEANLVTGGHPFNVGGLGRFQNTEWIEGVTSDPVRNLPALESLGLSPFPLLVIVWERRLGGMINVRLRASHGGAWVWTGAGAQSDAGWDTRPVTIDTHLRIAEMMMWTGTEAQAIQTSMGASGLAAYLQSKWALSMVADPVDPDATQFALPQVQSKLNYVLEMNMNDSNFSDTMGGTVTSVGTVSFDTINARTSTGCAHLNGGYLSVRSGPTTSYALPGPFLIDGWARGPGSYSTNTILSLGPYTNGILFQPALLLPRHTWRTAAPVSGQEAQTLNFG